MTIEHYPVKISDQNYKINKTKATIYVWPIFGDDDDDDDDEDDDNDDDGILSLQQNFYGGYDWLRLMNDDIHIKWKLRMNLHHHPKTSLTFGGN